MNVWKLWRLIKERERTEHTYYSKYPLARNTEKTKRLISEKRRNMNERDK